MRLIRSTGQNVSPSDDGRLFDQIFTDGLFADTTFAMLGANNVQIGTIYGDLCGRDFTIEQQTVAVALPEGEGETTGYIFVEIDTSAETPLSVGSALAPFTPTYEDVNVNGAVAQMIIAEYTASAVAVTSITAKYSRVSAGGIGSLAMIESSPATANHSAGSYLVYDGVLYKVRSAIAAGETLVPGTNITATTAGAELTSLNNDLTDVKSGSISAELSGVRVYNSQLNKNVKVVHLYALIDIPEINYIGEWIAAIPSEFIPSSNKHIIGTARDGTTRTFIITASGHLVNGESIPNIGYYFDSVWIV